MIKIAIGSSAFLFNQAEPTTDFHDLLHRLGHLGFDGVELGAFAPHPNPDSHDTRAKRDQLRRMVADHGLEFAALAPDLASQRLISIERADGYVAEFAKHLAFAADLGIKTICVQIPESAGATARQQLEPPVVLERVVRAFDRCAKLAAEHGVAVAWEFEPSRPLHAPSEIAAVSQQVRGALHNPNFGVLFNTCHAHVCTTTAGATHPDGMLSLLEMLRGHIVHLHLIDCAGEEDIRAAGRRRPFGAGVLDFQQLIPALTAAAPEAQWWTIDLAHWPDAWETAAECRRFLHRLRRKQLA